MTVRFNSDLSDEQKRKYFAKKPIRDNLVHTYETMLSYKLRITQLEHADTASLSPTQAVDMAVELRKMQSSLNTLGFLYVQLVDCYVMSEEEFAAWQYVNGIPRVPKIRPFQPKAAPVLRDATGQDNEAEVDDNELEAAMAELKAG